MNTMVSGSGPKTLFRVHVKHDPEQDKDESVHYLTLSRRGSGNYYSFTQTEDEYDGAGALRFKGKGELEASRQAHKDRHEVHYSIKSLPEEKYSRFSFDYRSGQSATVDEFQWNPVQQKEAQVEEHLRLEDAHGKCWAEYGGRQCHAAVLRFHKGSDGKLMDWQHRVDAITILIHKLLQWKMTPVKGPPMMMQPSVVMR